jgi:hypothetical protein
MQSICELRETEMLGKLIYEKDNISIHEVDGEEYKVGFNPKITATNG